MSVAGRWNQLVPGTAQIGSGEDFVLLGANSVSKIADENQSRVLRGITQAYAENAEI